MLLVVLREPSLSCARALKQAGTIFWSRRGVWEARCAHPGSHYCRGLLFVCLCSGIEQRQNSGNQWLAYQLGEPSGAGSTSRVVGVCGCPSRAFAVGGSRNVDAPCCLARTLAIMRSCAKTGGNKFLESARSMGSVSRASRFPHERGVALCLLQVRESNSGKIGATNGSHINLRNPSVRGRLPGLLACVLSQGEHICCCPLG